MGRLEVLQRRSPDSYKARRERPVCADIGIGDRVLNVRSIKPKASMISPRCPAAPAHAARAATQATFAGDFAGRALPLDEFASVHHASIATRDTGMFAGCGIRVIDPSDYAVIAREGSGPAGCSSAIACRLCGR
jgi:hypothetical protein